MLGILIFWYFFLAFVVYISFLNILAVDQYEYLHEAPTLIKFKRKTILILSYSKNKYLVSKKTIILELIGYLLLLKLVVFLILSFVVAESIGQVLLLISTIVVLTFGTITGNMYRKIKKQTNG